MNLTFKQVYHDDLDLIEVMLPNIGNPTLEKITSVLENYKHPNHHIIGSFDKLVGMVGFEINNNTAKLKNISVLEEFRKRGIAKSLIQYVIEHFSLETVLAKTDKDAVGFYKHLSFKCTEVNGKYGTRYQCKFERKLNLE